MRNGDRSTPATRRILDVGCGQNKFPGAIGIDANPRSHADVIHDLGVFPYPFANDEFDEIVCRHVIEHVPDVLGFVTELHRITKPGGRLKIVTPHYSNPDWATDPTHRNHFNNYSFTCFVPTRTPFPFYTTAELKPVTTHVSLANLVARGGIGISSISISVGRSFPSPENFGSSIFRPSSAARNSASNSKL